MTYHRQFFEIKKKKFETDNYIHHGTLSTKIIPAILTFFYRPVYKTIEKKKHLKIIQVITHLKSQRPGIR